jgi:hypothetical protein
MNAKDLKTGKSRFAGLPIYRQAPLALLFAPFILRLLPCFNAFWFDEIWSWQISRVVTSPLQILTNPLAQSDNNHPLNTLWMYLVGDTSQWWIYRLPSLLTGCATVLLILWMERKLFRWSALTICLLIGLSFPLITYSSEARGYAPMMLGAVAAYYLLRSNAWPQKIAFALICTIGLLCHLTFLHFLLAAGVGVLAEKKPRKLLLFTPTLIVFVAYIWIFLRHLQVGGAPPASTTATIAETLSLLLGGPLAGMMSHFIAVVVLACIAGALFWLYRRSMPDAFFFLTAIFLAPALTILPRSFSPTSAPSLQVRYLLVPFIFSLILLTRYFAAVLQGRSWMRKLCIPIIALATLGNGYHLGRFLAVGRSDYRAALTHMAANTQATVITWSSDNESNNFRVNTILWYYKRFLPPGEIIYPSNDPTWFILNILDTSSLPSTLPPFRSGSSIYQFDSIYPAYGLSGWSWVLYKKL